MKAEQDDMLNVHVNIDVPAGAVKAVVENAKQMTGKNEQGHYRIDTADMLSKMISRFLKVNDFQKFAENRDNYKEL